MNGQMEELHLETCSITGQQSFFALAFHFVSLTDINDKVEKRTH